jgi:GDP-L-fucose synthase
MRVYIAGITGMVGSALARHGLKEGYEVLGKKSTELDLRNRKEVFDELLKVKPEVLVIAAAKVGGIGANSTLPVDFLSSNLQIQTNLLDAANYADVSRVLFLGSSCIYPKFAEQPIKESELLNGKLEGTNEAYAIAKIAGLKLVEAYRKQFGRNWISAMPTNLYGPGDNFNLQTAHVLPALIHKFHIAKTLGLPSIEIWGDGTPLREFLHVEDLAEACFKLIKEYNEEMPINVGSGEEVSILELSNLVGEIVGFDGEIMFDKSKPNGTPRKLLDSSLIHKLGWKPEIPLRLGIASTYSWFLQNETKVIK